MKTISRYISAALCALLLAGAGACGHTHDHDGHDDHDGHSHEEHIILFEYTDTYELFAEVSPLAVGHEAEAEVHVTSLADFKPVADAKVTLQCGGVAAEGHSHSDGIYHFEWDPAKAGEATLTVTITSEAGTAHASWPVTVYSDFHEAAHEAHEAAEELESPFGIPFSKQKSWKVDFATAVAVEAPFGEVVRFMARVEPSEHDRAVLTAPNAGTVHLLAKGMAQGMQVRKGEALWRIDGSRVADGSLRVSLAEAKSAYEAAEAEWKRKEQLEADGLVSRSDLLSARREYETARAAYDHLRTNFSGGGSTVTSPVAGYVISLDVANGSFVEQGAPLATVASSRDMVLHGEVSPRQLPLVRRATEAYAVTGSGRVLRVVPVGGQLAAAAPAGEGSAMLPLTLRVAEGESLVPGTFAEVNMVASDGNRAILLPREAVVEEMGAPFVFVQITPEYFERRQVTLGASDGQRVSVLSGVKEGERVVTRGAVMVRLAGTTSNLDPHAGHHH